ncbi:winged helix-turn-helix transcriptional regulator [Brevibacterium spongiae]|uniref:Helix-turn-helix transcriptional regulator n=1 Tax=Brevibacterium spongiae TaxID=2909672 RepID=A0ABY5SR79_9MICO|nr:helix-turn-helix domain-containing protein [Brevibacterium spongiae]UVI35556.1 helix-turn-helix transcriptional regulator [Brevibacterium spongiae]
MKSYGQYCGLARAAEILGERWSLIILRDLLVGAKRFNELRQGIPGIPSNLLTTRLRDLESAGIVERSLKDRHVVYRLSEYGEGLGPVLIELGRWGSRRLAAPREDEVPTDSSLAAALLTSRTDVSVRPFTVEVTAGPAVAHAAVHESGVDVAEGADPSAQVFIGGTGLRGLLAGGDAKTAVADGAVTVAGDESLLTEFARAFRAPLDDAASTPPNGK